MPVAQLAQLLEERRRCNAHPALALHRLDHDGRGLWTDRRLGFGDVAEPYQVEAGRRLAKAFKVFVVAGRGDGRKRAAVKGALEGDDAPALGPPGGVMVTARELDCALARLGARVAEERPVGEGRGAQPVGQPLLAGDAVEVGTVPKLAGLLGQGRHQPRMGMTEGVDGNAARKIEIALATGGGQPGALAALEGEVL